MALFLQKKKSIWFMITILGTLGMNILTALVSSGQQADNSATAYFIFSRPFVFFSEVVFFKINFCPIINFVI